MSVKILTKGRLRKKSHSLVKTRLAERSLHDFTKQAWEIVEPGRPFIDGWHIHAICDHLEAMTKGDLLKLIINIPPRHMKSLSVAVFWFCWTWVHWPGSRWLFSCYSSELSIRDSRKCRDVLGSQWFQERWGSQWDFTIDTQHRFENSKRGMRMATSNSGKATGEGGDFLVADDPHKADEAHSKTNRHGVLNWWDGTMSTRGNDPKTTRRLVVMQRLHEGDLTGHLLEQDRGYDHLVLPARYEEDHPHKVVSSIGFVDPRIESGETLLWPERFDGELLTDLERQMGGTYNIAGQLQQRPSPGDGGMFQRRQFRYFREEIETVDDKQKAAFVFPDDKGVEQRVWADDCYWFQTADTTLKTGEENAYTVVMTFVFDQKTGRAFIYDVWRDRIPVPEQYAMLIGQRAKYPQLKFQAIEDEASGTSLIQEGRKQNTPFRTLKATGDKVSRCTAICIQYENRLVYHRSASQAEWLEKFEHEMLVFPLGEYADQVDSLAYGGIMMQSMGVQGMYAGRSLAYRKPADSQGKADGEDKSKYAKLMPKRQQRGGGSQLFGG